jgi:hypothetical protein
MPPNKTKKRHVCRNAWCGLVRGAAYRAGMPKGREILVSYEQNGDERVFCSGFCCQRWTPVDPEGGDDE